MLHKRRAHLCRHLATQLEGLGRVGDTEEKELTKHDVGYLKGLVFLFYQLNFWNKVGGDLIHDQDVAEAIFLHAVVSGTRIALEATQRASDNAEVDRKIGPNTIAHINNMDPELLLLRMAVAKVRQRVRIAHKDKSQQKFLIGWINRALKYV